MKFNASFEATVFFVEITAILFTISDANNGKNEIRTEDIPQSEIYNRTPKYWTLPNLVPDDTIPQSSVTLVQNPAPILQNENDQMKCDPLKPNYTMSELPKILTPEIISQVDPINYLIDKLQNTARLNLPAVKFELNITNNIERLSQCYSRYVEALSSLLRFWSELVKVKQFIPAIRSRRSSKLARISALPARISPTSDLYQLFTPDIFSDPQPPRRVFFKLLNLPKETVQNIRVQLQSFVNESPKFDQMSLPEVYTWYAIALNEIIRGESAFDELRRSMAEIQPESTSGQSFSAATPTKT